MLLGAMINRIDQSTVFIPLSTSIFSALGEPFDPNRHDAVMHEPADDDSGTTVVDVMRRGYGWKGRVLRPAMVKVAT